MANPEHMALVEKEKHEMRQKKRHQVQSREIVKAMDKLYAQYGKYALPDEEARKIVDEALGTKTLTGVLDSMREG